MTKYLIFDAGTLINLTSNGLLDIFKELAEKFQGEFVITEAVRKETIDNPMSITRFEWGALRIRQLLEDEVIKMIEDEKLVSQEEINKKTQEVMNLANSSLSSEGKNVQLIEKGESECLALSLLLTEKGIENVVVIDERTARMLSENPDKLRQLMENKLHSQIKLNASKLEMFKSIKIIRSTELMYIAEKKGLLDKDREEIEAVLYALKFGGCSISEKEVQVMSKM